MQKRILIVGAGPSGSYLAKLFSETILEDEVLIVDSRLGEYTRSGSIFDDVFEKIGITIENQVEQIKLLERTLYEQLKKTNITRMKAKFVGFRENKAVINYEGEDHVLAEVSQIIDCSGAARVVFKAAEQDNSILLTENPIKKHFIVQIRSAQLTEAMTESKKIQLERGVPLNCLKFKKLREQFGWQPYVLPTLAINHLKNDKILLIGECPDELSPNRLSSWLEAMLEIVFDEPIEYKLAKHYTKTGVYKSNFGIFTVQPTKIESPIYHLPNGPTIIACGDARQSHDYRLGDSIITGFNICHALMDCLRFITYEEITELVFNEDRFQSLCQIMLVEQENRIKILYRERKEKMEQGVEKLIEQCKKNISNEIDKENKALLIEFLKDLHYLQACRYEAIAAKLVKQYFDASKSNSRKIKQKNYLERAIDYLIAANNILDRDEDSKHQALQITILVNLYNIYTGLSEYDYAEAILRKIDALLKNDKVDSMIKVETIDKLLGQENIISEEPNNFRNTKIRFG